MILVGDRAMITDAHAATLKELGAGFVSALKTAQIRQLIGTGDLQLSLFDERNLAEITSPQFPGERLVVCRNPQLAADRARKREDLLQATERELEKVRQMVDGPRGSLKHASAGKIGKRAGRSVTSTRSPSTSSCRSQTARSPTTALTAAAATPTHRASWCFARTPNPASTWTAPISIIVHPKGFEIADRVARVPGTEV